MPRALNSLINIRVGDTGAHITFSSLARLLFVCYLNYRFLGAEGSAHWPCKAQLFADIATKLVSFLAVNFKYIQIRLMNVLPYFHMFLDIRFG